MTIGVLFVCTANICRSPMAKGVFRTLVRRAGYADVFDIDSAGTFDGHVGQPASLLARETTARRGYDISDHRARLLANEDLDRFDFPLAMDKTHLAAMRWIAPRGKMDRPQMFMRFAPHIGVAEVADPYGGPATGYERALDLIESGCNGLLEMLRPAAEKAMSLQVRPAG
ncbi:MAG: low molecular weight phosphotyrosine protein phosphatase [Enhydrobacter sp.]|nr:MAG: low molecular weight phosphotyrosine protein phosphatase [Enhydrobacter sp.]